MPPARIRGLDDSRSETSSTITNLKDRANMNGGIGAGISKGKKATMSALSGPMKAANVPASAAAGGAIDIEPGLPRTDWTTLAPSILNSYRTAHRLLTSSPYSKPHADLLYKSSPTALRAPSAVHARRRLRDLKHQRRKANGSSATINKPKAKSTDKDKSKELEAPAEQASASTSEHLLKPSLDGTALLNTTTTTSSSSSAPSSPPPPSIAPEYIGKQSPTALATAVRKHFNAQQLVEAETVARFIYVGRQGKSSSGVSRMEGSEGDGMGCWMGSQGREVRRGEGGEVGFRLRFRP